MADRSGSQKQHTGLGPETRPGVAPNNRRVAFIDAKLDAFSRSGDLVISVSTKK